MAIQAPSSLALLVSSPPYGQRVARADIDLALSAAALDFELHVYFLGHSVLQLAAARNTVPAMLPLGYKAWAALPGLTETHVYAEKNWLDWCAENDVALVMPVEALSHSGMERDWRRCRHAMVL